MGTIYPIARLRFLPDPDAHFLADKTCAFRIADPQQASFLPEPAILLSFIPFEPIISTVDNFRILTSDGEVLTSDGEALTW